MRGVLDASHRGTDIPGGCTCVLASLAPSASPASSSAELRAVNLGDSGFIVVRDGKTVFESPSQQHGFNMPYQLAQISVYPDSDDANAADALAVRVQEGDVIVAGSDGLFDNLFNTDIAKVGREQKSKTKTTATTGPRQWARQMTRTHRDSGIAGCLTTRTHRDSGMAGCLMTA